MDPVTGAWRSKRVTARPARKEDAVDLGAKFGISFDEDSDSSDGEFAPEDEQVDSDDSHEFDGEESVPGSSEKSNDSSLNKSSPVNDDAKIDESASSPAQQEYNPLIVRRSQRAIKPTKDIDLYLLGAKYGIDLEGSGADSSDMEFAPEAVSDAGSDSSGASDDNDVTAGSPTASKDDERSESHSVQQLPASINFEVPLCSVCLEDSGEDGDLVECDRCGIAVHEGCYGVPQEEEIVRDDNSDLSSFTTVPWFCDACKAGVSSSLCACELCPSIGGLFKQTIHGRWVHVVCILYTPNIEYVEPNRLSGVTLDQLSTSRWGNKVCQLCFDAHMNRTGVCIGCDAGLCKSSFHVTCAQQHGLLCEVDSDEDDDDEKEICDPFFAHCKAHADKDRSKRKRRDYLTVMNKHKKFKFDETDERIQHYLEEARVLYTKLFEKMQNYYHPEKGFQKEERFLHVVPSALRRLTMKAKLLGHISEELGEGNSHKKIGPSLTTDFVTYFHERQTTINSLQKKKETLSTSLEELEKEQATIKASLSALQKSLRVLRSRGDTTRSKVNLLYLIISKLGGGQELVLPTFLQEEGFEVVEDEEGGDLVCSVCHGNNEQHLMIVCDTCNQRFHIGCLDPPLTKVPKKSAKWGWQCHKCCCNSEDELLPVMANFDEPSSRSGRKIKTPQVLSYSDYQKVKQSKKKKKK